MLEKPETIQGVCPNCYTHIEFLSDETPENCECGYDWDLGRVRVPEDDEVNNKVMVVDDDTFPGEIVKEPCTLASSMWAMALPYHLAMVAGSRFRGFRPQPKKVRVCLLTGCDVRHTHNGGYCCADHCREDRA